MCDEFAKIIHDEFEMSMMGELNLFLGLQIKQMEDGILFNQSKYIKEMLKKFGLEDSKPIKTLMSFDTKLTKYEECESVDSTKYRGMIGGLLYLMVSRPDIMFSVYLYARFQEALKTSYLEAVKRIFRYIKGTTHLGLCSLDELVYGTPSEGPYQTNFPSPDDIISFIREDREEEIIQENVFYLGGNRDHVPACLCYMLYCVANSKKINLAYFMAKRMEWVTKQARLILPYGLLLTRLFDFILDENPKLQNGSYVLYDHVMNPLAAQLERKPRKDCGTRRCRHSTSSSTFNEPSSSHLNDNDDDDGNSEGTSCASTPSPIRYINSLTNHVP
nr:retrovirus-related Pol polyprotein from transposon TNT 1-94 [Tanacetum cinerariifolium]GEY81998.1 retrovirus-related Pol polyprotein from transposon TNT 1-94 [Tanacetum cinerariifolium]